MADRIYDYATVETAKEPGLFPVKLYCFDSARALFRDGDMIEAYPYLWGIFGEPPEIVVDPHTFAIAFVWGYQEGHGISVRALDVFSYKIEGTWNQANPDVDVWTFKDGVYRPEEREIVCETGLIVLGEEGKLRRRTGTLENYVSTYPDLAGLANVL